VDNIKNSVFLLLSLVVVFTGFGLLTNSSNSFDLSFGEGNFLTGASIGLQSEEGEIVVPGTTSLGIQDSLGIQQSGDTIEGFYDDFSSFNSSFYDNVSLGGIILTPTGSLIQLNGTIDNQEIVQTVLYTIENITYDSFYLSALVNLTNTSDTFNSSLGNGTDVAAEIAIGVLNTSAMEMARTTCNLELKDGSLKLVFSNSTYPGPVSTAVVSSLEGTITLIHNTSSGVINCTFGSDSVSGNDASFSNNTFGVGILSNFGYQGEANSSGEYFATADDFNLTYIVAEEESIDWLDTFTEDFSGALNGSFFTNFTQNLDLDGSSGGLRMNISLIATQSSGTGIFRTLQNVSDNDFIVSTFIDATNTSLTTAAYYETGLILHNSSAVSDVENDVMCVIANETGTGAYLYFYNETYGGDGLMNVAITDLSGTLSLSYNSTSGIYNCSFGDLSLSGIAVGGDDIFSVGLFGTLGNNDAPATGTLDVTFDDWQFTNGSTAHAEEEPAANPLGTFTEDFGDGLNNSFFITVASSSDVALFGGSLRINGSLPGVDDAREGFIYTNQTVSDNDFVVSTFINLTDNSVTTNAAFEAGLTLHNQSDTSGFFTDIICSVLNSTAESYSLNFYNETYDAEEYKTVGITDLSGNLSLTYNLTSGIYNCSFSNASHTGVAVGLSPEYSVGLFGTIFPDSPGDATAELDTLFDNFQFTNGSTVHAEEEGGADCGTVNEDVTLTGSVSSVGTCFTVNVSGITIDCDDNAVSFGTGDGVADGINISDFNNVTVQNCEISYGGSAGGTGGPAIRLDNSSNNTIQGSDLNIIGSVATSSALYLSNSGENTIEDVTIYSNVTAGVIVTGSFSDGNTFENNELYVNTSGFSLDSFTSVTAINNTIVVGGTNSKAFSLGSTSASFTLTNNTITLNDDSEYGVFFSSTDAETITGNAITINGDNSYGYYLGTGSSSNEIIGGTVIITGENSYGGYTTGSTLGNIFESVNVTITGNNSLGYYFTGGTSDELDQGVIITNATAADGIRINGTNEKIIFGTTITTYGDNSKGIHLINANSTDVSGNSITTSGDNSEGIFLTLEGEIPALAGRSNSNLFGENIISTAGASSSAIKTDLVATNHILNNTISTSGDSYGLEFSRSTGLNVTDANNISTINNSLALLISGNGDSFYNHTIGLTNLVEDFPILYNYSIADTTVLQDLDASSIYGFVVCAVCDNVTYSNVNFSGDGLLLLYTTNSVFENILIEKDGDLGLPLVNSDNNTFTSSQINLEDNFVGLDISSSDNNIFENLTITTEIGTAIEDDGANTNTLIFGNEFGEINWTSGDLTSSIYNLSINNTIHLVNNTVGLIDDSDFGNLNGSATIKIKQLTAGVTPYLLKDGIRCDNSDICNITSYAGGVLTADVASFSNYSTEEIEFINCSNNVAANITLNQNLNSTGTCFTVTGDNVTIDCAGYTITYGTGDGANDYGVLTNSVRSTVKNCIINESIGSNYQTRHAVFFNNTGINGVGTIFNNTITTHWGTGVKLYGQELTVVENNTIFCPESCIGIDVDFSDNGQITGNNVTSTNWYGIQVKSSSTGNVLSNNYLVAGSNSINDFSAGQNSLIYNNAFGEIVWTDTTFLNEMDVVGDIGHGLNLFIGDNVASLATSAFIGSSINSSANITLYGLIYNSVDQVVSNPGYFTDSDTLLGAGSNCNGTTCEILDYNSSTGTLNFNTTILGSFAGYLTGEIIGNPVPSLTSVTIAPPSPTVNFDLGLTPIVNSTGATAAWAQPVCNWQNNKTGSLVSDELINLVFHNNSGTLLDLSENGFNGSIAGSLELNSNINMNGSLYFNETDHVNITNFDNINLSNPSSFTLAISFDPDDNFNTSGNSNLLGLATAVDNYFGFNFDSLNRSGIVWTNSSGGGVELQPSSGLNFSDGPFILYFVYNDSNGNASLYIDGVLEDSIELGESTAMDVVSSTMGIGSLASLSADPTDYNYSGDVGGFKFWNRSLSTEQIVGSSGNIDLFIQNTLIQSEETSLGEQWAGSCFIFNNLGYLNETAVESSTVTISVADDSPVVGLISPAESYFNDSVETINLTFECNITDDNALTNVSLYITNSSDKLFALNQTTNIGGVTNSSSWILELGVGDYTWNCLAYDNASQLNWASNRTITLNYTDNAPYWSSNTTGIQSKYDPILLNYFNITWGDETGVDTVYFESNYSGTAVNYTMNNITTSVYNYSVVLPAGTFYWKSYANDSSGQLNSSSQWTFTLDQNSGLCDMKFNVSSPINYSQTVLAYTNCGSDFTLYRNGTVISNNSVHSLGVGSYNFTVIRADQSNYSKVESEGIVVVNQVNSNVALVLSELTENISINVGATINLNCSADSLEAPIYLYADGILINSGTSPIGNSTNYGDIGLFNVTCSYTASQNYSASSETYWITVEDVIAPSFTESPGTQTIEYGSAFVMQINVTDNVAVANYTIDDGNFTINNSGYLQNDTLLALGTYELNITANDTSGNVNSIVFNVTVQDTTVPSFTQNPSGSILELGSAYAIQVNVTDNVAVDNYSVGNSSFTINDSGYLQNVTALEIAVYELNVTVNDTSSNENSVVFNVTIQDTNTPTITSIVNTTLDNETALGVQFAATDLGGVDSWFINDTTNFQINSTGYLTNNTALIIQEYWLNITVNDTSGNEESEIIFVNVTAAVPIFITLVSPANNYANGTSPVNITFNCNVTAGNSLENMTLYVWNTTVEYATNFTNVSGTTNETSAIIELVEETYYWNCLVYDNESDSNWASSNRTLTIDETSPIVSLSSPTESSGSVVNQAYVIANVTITESNFANLTYYLYNSTGGLESDTTLTSTPYNTTFTSLSDGLYYYNATVCDIANNCGSTTTYNITLDTTYPAISYVSPTTSTGNYSQDYIEINVTASDDNLDTINIWLYKTGGSLVQSKVSGTSPYFFNFTALPDETYYLNVTVNDTVGLTNQTSTYTIILDTTKPSVTALLPSENTTYRTGISTQLSANVTDAILSVDTVSASVIYPNGSSSLVTLNQIDSTDQYNNSFTIPSSLNGRYNITFIANDTVNNINNAETTYFNAEIYGVNITQPANQTTNNVTAVNYTFTITNNGTTTDNYTILEVDASNVGTLNQTNITSLSSGSSQNITLTVSSSTAGNYTVYVNVTSDTYSGASTQKSVTTEVLSGPLISSTIINPNAVINGSSTNLYIASTNNQSVWAIVTLPNGTDMTVDLTNSANTSFSNTSIIGRYNVTFFVNDSYGAEDNETDYFEAFEAVTYNLSIIDFNDTGLNTTLNIYYRGVLLNTTNITNGTLSGIFVDSLVDLELKSYSNRLQVTLRDMNLSAENAETIGVDKLATAVTGYIGTYGINNTFNFTNATIRIYYDDLSPTNEGYLGFYKCDDWNFTGQSCSGTWSDVTSNATQSTTNDYFELLVTSFSGFSVKQEDVPVVVETGGSSGGGGGGGGGSAGGKTYIVNADQFIEGYSKELEEADRFKVTVGEELHYVTLNETYSDRVKVIVQSDPQEATIYLGKTKYFELTGDNAYDLSVTLDQINLTGEKATLTVKSETILVSDVIEEIIEEIIEGEVVGETPIQEIIEEVVPEEVREEEKKELNLIWLWILLIIVLLILIGYLAYRYPPKKWFKFKFSKLKFPKIKFGNKKKLRKKLEPKKKVKIKKLVEKSKINKKSSFFSRFFYGFNLAFRGAHHKFMRMSLTTDKVEKRAHDLLFAGLPIKKAVEIASLGKKFTQKEIKVIENRLNITKDLSENYLLDKSKSWEFIKFVKSEIKHKRNKIQVISDLLDGGLSKEHSEKLFDVYYKKN
jgi:hypothetical protein